METENGTITLCDHQFDVKLSPDRHTLNLKVHLPWGGVSSYTIGLPSEPVLESGDERGLGKRKRQTEDAEKGTKSKKGKTRKRNAEQKKNPVTILSLPSEVQELIFFYLPLDTTLVVHGVCKQWRAICTESYWRQIFIQRISTSSFLTSYSWMQRVQFCRQNFPIYEPSQLMWAAAMGIPNQFCKDGRSLKLAAGTAVVASNLNIIGDIIEMADRGGLRKKIVDKALSAAVLSGNLQAYNHLREHHNAGIIPEEGDSWFMLNAARRGCKKMLAHLLTIDPALHSNYQKDRKKTLNQCVENGWLDMVPKMVAAGESLRTQHIRAATRMGQTEMLKFLLQQDAIPKPIPAGFMLFVFRTAKRQCIPTLYNLLLPVCPADSHKTRLKQFLREMNRVDWKGWLPNPSDDNEDDPATAVLRDLVRKTVEATPKGNDYIQIQHMAKKEKKQALHIAAIGAPLRALQVLVTEGKADLNARTSDNRTPLSIAVAVGRHESVISYLLSCGADVNIADDKGFDPISLAAKNRDMALVHMLCTRSKTGWHHGPPRALSSASS